MMTPGSANALLLADAGYQIQRSVRTRGAYPASPSYFNRTAGTPTNNLKWTFSLWVKRGVLSVGQHLLNGGTGTSASEDYLHFLGTNKLGFYQGNGTTTVIATNAVFRDPSAWYHIVLVYDSAQATAANRLFIYVNGVSQSFSSTTYPPLNQTTNINANGVLQRISSRTYLADEGFDGYMAEVNFIDGQALTPASFGETNPVTGVWSAKKYAGTYGTNGFYLNFSDNSAATATTIGKDSSGNGNNWTPNNISVTAGVTYDSMLDVPLGAGGPERGNYAVLSPLATNTVGVATLTNGNLTFSIPNTFTAIGSMSATSGKYYWEAIATSNPVGVGLKQVNVLDRYSNTIYYMGSSLSPSGEKYVNGTGSAYGASWTTGDVIGVAVDMDGGTVTFYKNNASQGSIALSTASITEFVPSFVSGAGVTFAGSVNFGQRPFAYTPPSGFKALHTGNLPEPAIVDGGEYFDATTYTGNGGTQSIVNSGAMQPDLVWLKSRGTARDHRLMDSVRGINNVLQSNLTAAEYAGSALSAINSNGFSLTTTDNQNANGEAYVGWQWRASNAAAVTNTAGSITSSVSANTTAGFSVVTYTGTQTAATVGHGLGVAPRMIIVKARSNGTFNWTTWHGTFTGNGYIYIDGTNAVGSSSGPWNGTLPTSSVFSLGADLGTNRSADTYVAYCFSEVAGYSKFGSYTGNGSADGPFVYTGFRPRWLMVKRTDSTGDWWMYDTSRSAFNTAVLVLYANSSAAEISDSNVDILSNGFKLRSATFQPNTSGGTFIYMAFAENPFKNSLAR